MQAQMTPEEFRRVTDAEYERCGNDYTYWRWQGTYAYSVEKGVGTRHIPKRPYNWEIVRFLANRSLRHKAWPKSRQMQMTWELSAYYMWYAQFHPDTENLVVNKKEEDSAYIVYSAKEQRGRIWTIYRNQPKWLRGRCPAEKSHNTVSWTHNRSFIKGLPEGEEQLHQYQASNTWFDEAARSPRFKERFFGGAGPMSENVHVTSTPDEFDGFHFVVMDKKDADMIDMVH